MDMPERMPKTRAGYDAAQTTPRPPFLPPTITGNPDQCGAAGDLGGGEEGVEIGVQDGARPRPRPVAARAGAAAGRPVSRICGSGPRKESASRVIGFLLVRASRRPRRCGSARSVAAG